MITEHRLQTDKTCLTRSTFTAQSLNLSLLGDHFASQRLNRCHGDTGQIGGCKMLRILSQTEGLMEVFRHRSKMLTVAWIGLVLPS